MSIRKATTGVYRPEIAFAMYKEHITGKLHTEEIIKAVMPLALRVLKSKLNAYWHIHDEMLAACAVSFSNILRRKPVEFVSAGAFTRYMVAAIYNTSIDVLKQWEPVEYDYDYDCSQPPMGKVRDYRDVDSEMLLTSSLDEVERTVLDRLRFWGDARALCIKYLRSLCANEPLPAKILCQRYRYNLSEVEFYQNYVKVILKAAMYDIKVHERLYAINPEWSHEAKVWDSE